MSVEDHTVSFSLELNVREAEERVRKLETILYRSMDIVKRLSGSEDLNALISQAQKAIQIANQLRLALLALQAARMAAGDPLAWAMAGIAVAEVGISIGSEMEMRRPQY